jgi:hypothetical protein
MSWSYVAAVAIAAVAAVVVIWRLTGTDRPFTFALDNEGKFTVTAEAGDDFDAIIDRAIEENPALVEAVLSNHDYYSVNSVRLVDALERLGAAEEPGDVTLGIRKLLWNLDGPFRGPGTLAMADERFMRALEELDRPVNEPGDKSRLIIELWQRGLERESPLGVRTFRASVVPVRPAGEPNGQFVFLCPGTGLGSKAVTLWTTRGGLITGVLAEDNRRLPCTTLRVALDRLFAGDPLTLGVDPATYQALADPQRSGEPLPEKVEALFEVQPAKLTALISMPD